MIKLYSRLRKRISKFLIFRQFDNSHASEFKQNEIDRVKKLDRYSSGVTMIFNRPVQFVDNASLLFIYDEIFIKNIYSFKSNSPNPYIIDCGANIGLSAIYFNRLYPSAEIVAFEPDPKVFSVLKYNVESFGITNIKLIQKALWDREGYVSFWMEGADGGRISKLNQDRLVTEVPSTRLRQYINRKVDFLKIDIEGAEFDVLLDCRDLLSNVDRIFVEYHSFVEKAQELDKLLLILRENNFRYVIQHIGVFSSHPFVKVDSYMGMDNQLNIFAYKL